MGDETSLMSSAHLRAEGELFLLSGTERLEIHTQSI